MEDPYPTGKHPDSKVRVCALFLVPDTSNARYVAKWGIALCSGRAGLTEKESRETGHRSDTSAISSDIGPLKVAHEWPGDSQRDSILGN